MPLNEEWQTHIFRCFDEPDLVEECANLPPSWPIGQQIVSFNDDERHVRGHGDGRRNRIVQRTPEVRCVHHRLVHANEPLQQGNEAAHVEGVDCTLARRELGPVDDGIPEVETTMGTTATYSVLNGCLNMTAKVDFPVPGSPTILSRER